MQLLYLFTSYIYVRIPLCATCNIMYLSDFRLVNLVVIKAIFQMLRLQVHTTGT